MLVLVDTELSERLRRYFQLTYALVVSGPFADTPALREALGRAAADLFAETEGPIGQRDQSAGQAGGGYPNWPGW